VAFLLQSILKVELLKNILTKYQFKFHAVVPFNPLQNKLLHLDFTEKNRELTEEILNDTKLFTAYINQKLTSAGARYGIGGYNEYRTVYSRSALFGNNGHGNNSEEPRRLHLGIDIWGKPHTKVMAPLDGIVHSFAFNNAYGDYGATIILSHNIESINFFTLYGHLSLNSIKNCKEGETIYTGDVIAEFGIPAENGHWPPHLHFQIIENIGEWKGDYPGVCKISEKDFYLKNCPDPDIILQLMKQAIPG
jgi:murein DD-endopeptidase MepM/ murein hydrolase activator NlpD